MQKIKSKDTVIVLAGKDKGKTGVVQKVLMPRGKKTKMRILVEGINLVKKHVRGNPQQEQPGGIIEKEAALDISNVALLNPTTGKADRVGFKILEKENRRVRIFKSTGEVVDV
ncbi:MAG TPA: 50S ribosomal protein L24 [Gammaproteobacteria bacterium]|nr:50S ribosomal protein L24 [Gammaproteobacteria bacterium]